MVLDLIIPLWQNEWIQKVFWIVITLIGAKVAIKVLMPLAQRVDDQISSVDLSHQTHEMIKKLIRYGIWAAAVFIIIDILGVKGAITTALAGAGIAGIAIGFAAKDTLSNMISGIFLFADRPFKLKDTVEIGGNVGKVRDITLRNTVIKTFDNKIVTIPNSVTSKSTIINYSRMSKRRVEIPVGIAYEADMDKAVKTIMKVLKKDENVLDKPEPSVAMVGLGDFSVDLKVMAWIENRNFLTKKTKLIHDIKKALDKAKVEIPYPKRVMITKKG